jgi:hypothetical protein
MNGKPEGDPAKLPSVRTRLASLDQPPLRFPAGSDAVATVETKANDLLAQAHAYRELPGNPGLAEASDTPKQSRLNRLRLAFTDGVADHGCITRRST